MSDMTLARLISGAPVRMGDWRATPAGRLMKKPLAVLLAYALAAPTLSVAVARPPDPFQKELKQQRELRKADDAERHEDQERQEQRLREREIDHPEINYDEIEDDLEK